MPEMLLMLPNCPVTNTIIHEKKRMIMVRTAVAAVESVFLMPIFARIDVTPAKKAEPNANAIHINFHLRYYCRLFALIVILNTNKIQEKICAEILYMRDYRLDFFQILNGV